MVVNLDPAGEPGSHWVAIFAPSPERVLHFDSYAQEPKGEILAYLRKFPAITVNDFVVQSVISSVCAHYCVYFLHECCRGVEYESILKSLADKPNPDQFVLTFTNALH
jgi:hypothetical protein